MTNKNQNHSKLCNLNLPTYIQESLHQAGLTAVSDAQAVAIAQNMAHYEGPEEEAQ